MEDTVAKTVSSILDSTYTNIECIIVDDASTDSSRKIVETFKDCRVVPIYNESNIGAGLSRRKGIQTATGDYIMFVDSDDTIDSFFIERLVTAAEYHNADIVEGGVILSGQSVWRRKEQVIESSEKKLAYLFNKKYKFLNVGLFRKNLVDRCPEYCGRPYIEDTPSYIHYLMQSNKVVVVDYPGYLYNSNPNSLTHTASRLKNAVFNTLAGIDIEDCLNQYGLTIGKTVAQIIEDLFIALEYGGLRQEYNPSYDKYLDMIIKRYKQETLKV